METVDNSTAKSGCAIAQSFVLRELREVHIPRDNLGYRRMSSHPLASLAASVVGAYLHSRRHGQRDWQALFFVLLAYWVAFMINASFDVYLEGPMGGIWLWTVIGVGLAAVAIHRRNPEVMEPLAA